MLSLTLLTGRSVIFVFVVLGVVDLFGVGRDENYIIDCIKINLSMKLELP